ncbi:HYR domain-containing protein [Halobacillus campisalis]
MICTPSSGSFFEIGMTEVECIARDIFGNESLPCSFTVTVNDTEAPLVSCLPGGYRSR